MDEMLKQQLKEEVAQFRQKAEQFMRGEINIKEFKGFSGGFGSYAQRGKTHLMLRLRMDQGVMSKEKLAFVCDSCRRHDVDLAHITTCQTSSCIISAWRRSATSWKRRWMSAS